MPELRVAITRPEGRGAGFARRLHEAGHEPLEVPLTTIRGLEPFPDPCGFDGVLFTSVSAVERAPIGEVDWPRVGAVGKATARALRARGIRVDVTGSGGGAELADAWGEARGQRLLLPQALQAHATLAEALRSAGAEVVAVAVYETVARDDVDRDALRSADVVCFFAPSAVYAFAALGLGSRARYWGHGPTTRSAMRDHGLEHTDDLPWSSL